MYSNLIIPIKDELIISPAMRELKDIKNRLALRKLVPVIYSSFQLDMKDPMDVDDLTTATAKCLKETTTLYALKIFGARLLTDITTKSQKVVLPIVKESYLELFKASTTTQITQNFCTTYELHAEEQADSRYYLL